MHLRTTLRADELSGTILDRLPPRSSVVTNVLRPCTQEVVQPCLAWAFLGDPGCRPQPETAVLTLAALLSAVTK